MKRINVDWTPKKRYERKRIETLFSQLDDQMLIKRNYAKSLLLDIPLQSVPHIPAQSVPIEVLIF